MGLTLDITFEVGNQELERKPPMGSTSRFRHQSDRFRCDKSLLLRNQELVFPRRSGPEGTETRTSRHGLPIAAFQQADLGIPVPNSISLRLQPIYFRIVSIDTVRAKLTGDDINLPRIPPTRAGLVST